MKQIYILFTFIAFALSLASCSNTPDDIIDLQVQKVAIDDSTSVAYRTYGSGRRAIVFVHGFGCDMNSWEAQFDILKEDKSHILVFIDLPGYGISDKPHIDYTLSFFAKAVESVIDDTHVQNPLLVGHSLGTAVCRQVCFEQQDRIGGLCDIDGVYCFYDNATPEYIEAIDAFSKSFDGDSCREVITGFVYSLAGPDTPQEITEYALSVMPQIPEYVASSTMRNLVNKKWWNGSIINVPTVVICTKNSGLEADNKEKMEMLYSNLDYTELSTCGHFIMLELPEIVSNKLNQIR
ncbi:MAG: alpha/beta hydrolase [Bacteroidales bacterium]|nr:alpha/beta hydrolase [Bacteroidales bacterium]